MHTLLFLGLIWALEAGPAAGSSGGALVADAVTIEGSASMEVTADTCVMEFVISRSNPSAKEAVAALKDAKKSLETAVRTVIGAGGAIEVGPPRVARRRHEKGFLFEARQTTTARITSFPKASAEFTDFLAKIAVGVAETGVTPEDVEGPIVSFEITRPQGVEERLAAMAVADAQKRVEIASKLLKRNLRRLRSGYFPAGVASSDGFARFSNIDDPVKSDRMTAVITYTVLMAYELEL